VEFLNVLAIKKIAFRKGCTAERTATIKYKHYVRLIGPDGLDNRRHARRRAGAARGEATA
jgi:hypothetical protein